MERTYSSEPLERFTYHPQCDGTAVVYLHENIEKNVADAPEGEDREFWTADEAMTRTTLPFEDVEANFDALWVKAEKEATPFEERLSSVEELIDATMAVVLGEE
ncbi:hypothetical protein [Adlercreutzia sp. ZJ242]|uniref:hypothetical protein n=1 Tax=Adlercreutzia sp. ZJ242 TaxID=2709409 RepID=UPI0013E99EFE|nr:hypothetical protein [Adlercreutzia sp. ZJ242]